MINFTKLYCGVEQPADGLRYGRGHDAPKSAGERKPIVVWNITRTCNLKCVHCYSDSEAREYSGELTFQQCQSVVDDLASFGAPAVLLSGGEPLTHSRFFDLAAYARGKGLKLTLSTNGTLLDLDAAEKIRALHFTYVGISLDGVGETHDHFRGKKGAFEKAVKAFRNCKRVGQKVGLRLTLSKRNIRDLDQILDFIEEVDIERVCFYHLVYSGRGAELEVLQPEEIRNALEKILAKTVAWAQSGKPREVLTVDQPADGAWLWMKMADEKNPRADEVYKLLKWNGGGANGSGVGIGNIDSQGNAHPDQFWQTRILGNVKEKSFSEIWTNSGDAVLKGLRNRRPLLKGRCKECRFQEICGGGFRVRAFQKFGDPWAEDPGCYLKEIKN